MTCPIVVEPVNGQFAATLVGVPGARVLAATRELAVDGLKAVLDERVQRGELQFVELAPVGVTSFAGKYRDDETLSDICEAAYKARDAERQG